MYHDDIKFLNLCVVERQRNKKTSGKISLVAHFNLSRGRFPVKPGMTHSDYRLINPSVSLDMAS